MRVYHFVPGGHGLQNIELRRMKIATLDQLNDPFEMLAVAPSSPEHRAAFRRTKAQMAQQTGLLCFSRRWGNPVQWSHYADCHKGLCLGFDVADELVEPVRYQPKRILFDPAILDDEGQASAFMLELSCTKFSHWSYEDEVRVFVGLDQEDRENGLYFMPFSPQLALREVIVGAESRIERAELASALGSLGSAVEVRKARLAFRTFRVVTQLRADQWR